MNQLDSKLVERFVAAIDAEDKKAAELMSNGLLRDMREYGHAAGYRKALHDAKTLLTEAFEDLMKE
jgi:hypothetical protein